MFNKITYVTGKDHEAMSEVAGSGIYMAGRRISVMGRYYGMVGMVYNSCDADACQDYCILSSILV